MEVNYWQKRLYYKEKVINLLQIKSQQIHKLYQVSAVQSFE